MTFRECRRKKNHLWLHAAALGGCWLLLFTSPYAARAVDCNVSSPPLCGSCAIGSTCINPSDRSNLGTCIQLPATSAPLSLSGTTVQPGNQYCSAPASQPAADTKTKEQAPASPAVKPTLAIDIPTVRFSDLQPGGDTIDVPWLAEYIAGIYQYAVFIGSIIAIVMIMVGGLQWLTSAGNATHITAARNRITGAITGLVLLVGSYLIMHTINPDLVSLSALRVQTVQPDPIQIEHIATLANTGDPADLASTGGSGASGGSSSVLSAGQYTPRFTSCPLTLTTAPAPDVLPNQPGRAQEFTRQIGARITTTNIREKILQIAEAAARCDVDFGSCGRTVEQIYELAGSHGWGRQAGRSGVGWRELRTYRCCLAASHRSCQRTGRSGGLPSNCLNATPPCVDTPGCGTGPTEETAQAAAQAVARVRIPATAGSGYPDNLANSLEPGDNFQLYNGNSSPASAHSVIFLGWGTNGCYAQVIEGNVRPFVSFGQTCIRVRSITGTNCNCGDRLKMILFVGKPA